jgi:predicted RNA-binding protein with PUA-like domain
VKEYINQQKTKGTKIIVSPRKKPWYWQWSTKPEFFLEANGDERKDLEPGTILPPGAWWTCHKDTRAGDLVFLYRAGKKDGKTYQDIKYLIMAKSDAYSVTIDEFAFEHGWKYGCDFEVLYKFKNPLTLNEIREEPFLDDWNAFRALFRLSAYKTEPRHWNKINEILAEKNPDYMKYLDEPVAKEKIRRIKSELELEESLYNHIEAFKKFGYDLEVIGRQVICKGEGGFMDILCRDKADGSYVVIELKIVPADQSAFAQISYYVAWVEKRMARGKPVKGIVISKGQDNRFKLAVNRDENIEHIQLSEVLSELGMKLT